MTDERPGSAPTNSAQGMWWDVELSSRALGRPLAVGTYTNAMRAAFAATLFLAEA